MLTSGAVRVALAAMATAVATCSTPPQHNTTPAAPTGENVGAVAEEEGPRTFDPDVVRRDPASVEGQALAALEGDDPEAAGRLVNEALAAGGHDDPHRLWWLSARASQAAGRPAQAFATLASVASADHPLAPWARLWRARILMEGDPALAAAEVEPLLEDEWAGRNAARELRAAALVAANQAELAEPLLRELLAEAGPDSAAAAAAMPLAALLAAREDTAAKIEAIGLYRRVATRAPLSSVGRDAEAQVAAILAALPRAERRRLAEPSAEDLFARATALAAAVQFEDAEAAFGEVVERTRDEALQCRARLGQGRAIYYRRQRRRAAEHLVQVARDCEQTDVRAWAYYLAGKGFRSAGEDELALAQYARLEATTPEHSLADDARYNAALIEGELGREAEMIAHLTSLPTDYPRGDMRARALFMLAWRARRAGDTQTSLTHLATLAADDLGEDREDLAGRANYWRGRILADTDQPDDAVARYMDTVREAPLSYYAQQALARLEETDEANATAARALLGRREDGAIRFPWRAELDTDAFARALALFGVGAIEEAERELSWIEARANGDREIRWIHAALLDRAGEHSRAVFITRRQLREFMDEPPAGEHFARWRIAYPRAFAGAIEAAAAETPVPAELIFAIAREESSFNPSVVSVAHAYGLTQLLVPTARRFGRGITPPPSATTLRDPVVNVRIGAAYMGWLWNRYEENPVVLPSAYNAGQGATDRWLRERPDQKLDEWIEDIPYDETRRYTRRVLQTWGIYTWLDRGELPELPARLPRR